MNKNWEFGHDKTIIIRISSLMLFSLDRYADKYNISRAEAVRRAIVALTGAMPTPRKPRGEHCPLCNLKLSACRCAISDILNSVEA